MKSITKVVLLSSVLAIALLATACPQRTSIGKIEANPSRYVGKEVAVAGTVRNSFGVSIPIISSGSGGIYKIDDGTGSLWVITKRGVPSKGVEVGVKGKIQNGVSFNGKNYGLVLMEDDRRFKGDK
jgi:hypothetical protein